MNAGTRLGRYEVIAHLASGGMASVYLARSVGAQGFHRLVAIKRLHPHIASDAQFVSMFMDEARLAAQIRHPNVVPTLDLENAAGGPYLAMELIEGDSLHGLLKTEAAAGRDLPPPIVLRILIDVLRGLHAAHDLENDRGEPLHIVHRDVSPHNILVGVDGIARITDFGVARAEERSTQTRTGQVKGKLAYMAPEMTTSSPFDRRADVFAAGIVLWECLTGKRLFKTKTDAEALRALLEAPIPHLRDVSPEYPEPLGAVVARALEREPKARWPTAGDFADAIEDAASDVGIATQRGLASYVKRVAAEPVEQLRRTVREWTDGSARTLATRPIASDTGAQTRVTGGHTVFGAVRSVAPVPGRRALLFGLVGGALLVLAASVTAVATRRPPRGVMAPNAVEAPKRLTSIPSVVPSDNIPTLDLTDVTTLTPKPRPQTKRAPLVAHSSKPYNPESM